MRDKIMNFIPYFLFVIIFTSFIMFSKINNIYIISVFYIAISLYFILNLFKKTELDYKRYIYLLWILLTIVLYIFFFSIFNVLISLLILGMIILQMLLHADNSSKKEINKEEKKVKKVEINIELPKDFDVDKFEEESKKLYIDMQTYFMNLEYDNLKNILNDTMYEQFSSQMQHLEKNNKRAMRENIDIFDFKINEYEKRESEETLKVSIGVYEDKYTKYLDSKNEPRIIGYESYYELTLTKNTNWIISNLKLLYSHSKKN